MAQERDRIAAAFARVGQQFPELRSVGYANTGDQRFVTGDGRTTYTMWFDPPPRGFVPPTSRQAPPALAAAVPPGFTTGLTGLDALSSAGSTSGPGVLVETLVGGLGALAVLAFVFASFLALVPMLVAAVAITTTLLIVLGITTFADVSFIVQYLVALIGLGVAIDYSLLIVTRWREERDRGRSNSDAVLTAVETAGQAVLFSGGTVAIGLFALVLLPVPFLRSIGYGGMLVPIVSVLVSLTLLSALLGGIGPRVDWPRVRHERAASRPWSRWAGWVTRHPHLAGGLATALLVALFIPFLSVKVGLASSESLARSGPAFDSWQLLRQGRVPGGALTPIEVLVRDGQGARIAATLGRLPGIETAVTPSGPGSRRGGAQVVDAIPDRETVNASSIGPVRAVSDAVRRDPAVLGVSGVGALQLDYRHAVYDNFPLLVGITVVVTFVLLARAFRSLLLPAKAVVLNLASVAATFGAVVLFWQQGHGSEQIFGIQATGAITFWMPIMIFAFLYGLSMDYEVFILARMREEYDGATRPAVVEGIGRTGRLVTSAALILFLAFASLASGPQTDIKVFATALGVGILLDATVVRAMLVPALVTLFGRWNWWLPPIAARLLRVAPSPAVERPAAAPEAAPELAGR